MGQGTMEPDNTGLSSALEGGRGYHDIGGLEGGPVDPNVTDAKPWEKLSVALSNVLGRAGKKLICTDETRRTREEMGVELYNRLGYFERGTEALRLLLVEKGLIDQKRLESRMAEIETRIKEQGR